MDYHVILEDDSILASFINEYDRDLFLEALLEEHPDVPTGYFTAVNDE